MYQLIYERTKKTLLELESKRQPILCNQQNPFFKSQTKIKTEKDYILKLFLQWFSTHTREVMWAVTKLEPAMHPNTLFTTLIVGIWRTLVILLRPESTTWVTK